MSKFLNNRNVGILDSVAILTLLFSIWWVSTCVFMVAQDQQGIVLQFGGYERTAAPGLHFKWPRWIETVYKVNTQKVYEEEFGFRSDKEGKRKAGRGQLNKESLMLTSDLGVADVEWVVQYRKTNPKRFLFSVYSEKGLIRLASLSAVRRIAGDFPATTAITTGRTQIAQRAEKLMQDKMQQYRAGISIEDVLIQSSEPPGPVQDAFQAVDRARQKREQLRNEALKQKEKRINEAKGDVSRMVSEAKGEAKSIINNAKGRAERFEEVLKQYQAAPDVTEDRMLLETMGPALQQGELYVVDKSSKGILPLLDLKKGGVQ